MPESARDLGKRRRQAIFLTALASTPNARTRNSCQRPHSRIQFERGLWQCCRHGRMALFLIFCCIWSDWISPVQPDDGITEQTNSSFDGTTHDVGDKVDLATFFIPFPGRVLTLGRAARCRSIIGGSRGLSGETSDLLARDQLTQHVEAVVDLPECFCVTAFIGMAHLDVVEVMLFDESPLVFKGQALG